MGFTEAVRTRPGHVSLFDGTLHGMARTGKPALCFQGRPQAGPGPRWAYRRTLSGALRRHHNRH